MAAVVREAVDDIARHIAPAYQPAFRGYGDYFTRFEGAPASSSRSSAASLCSRISSMPSWTTPRASGSP